MAPRGPGQPECSQWGPGDRIGTSQSPTRLWDPAQASPGGPPRGAPCQLPFDSGQPGSDASVPGALGPVVPSDRPLGSTQMVPPGGDPRSAPCKRDRRKGSARTGGTVRTGPPPRAGLGGRYRGSPTPKRVSSIRPPPSPLGLSGSFLLTFCRRASEGGLRSDGRSHLFWIFLAPSLLLRLRHLAPPPSPTRAGATATPLARRRRRRPLSPAPRPSRDPPPNQTQRPAGLCVRRLRRTAATLPPVRAAAGAALPGYVFLPRTVISEVAAPSESQL